ncbi:MAG: RCC1 domain-containing protein [Vicinamibacterales bacterium]
MPGLANVKAISLGSGHAAVLLADGTLRMWGHNGFGQIGIAAATDYHLKPVPVKSLTSVSAIYLGGMRSFAVRSDGTLWTSGFASGAEGIVGKYLRVPTMVELP